MSSQLGYQETLEKSRQKPSSVFWSSSGQPYSKTQTHPSRNTFFNQKRKNKDPLKRVYKKTTSFSMIPFVQNLFFSSHKNHSKSPKKPTPEKPLHNPKLNQNSHSRNTPFLTTFLTQKSATGKNIYAIFVLFQVFDQIIKPTVKYMIALHIPKLL